MPTAIVHIQNEDPVVGEIEAPPGSTDYLLTLKNPRKRDGKDVAYIDPAVNIVVYPWWRINFVEIMPSAEEEEIITFVRE
jgi:hypothetical protein